MDSKEVTIIGAGLVGCFMGILLTQKGFKVTIFESQPDARITFPKGKAINLALSTRGVNALKAIGYDQKILSKTIPMYGRLIHNLNSPDVFQPYGDSKDEVLHSTSRAVIQKDLLTYAEDNGVAIHFQVKCDSIDLLTNTLTLQDAQKKLTSMQFNVLIGADGTNSTVRRSIELIYGKENKTFRFPMIYKQFNILPDQNRQSKLNRKEVLHIWPGAAQNFVTALPNIDNSYNCALFLPTDGQYDVNNLTTQQMVNIFDQQFSSLAPLLENISESHEKNPFGLLWTVNTDRWFYKNKVVLIGDAAHGVVPYYGLGVNMGFEDCVVIGKLIEKNQSTHAIDWEVIFSVFSQRKVDSDALGRLSQENATVFHTGIKNQNFLLKKTVERELQKRFPDLFAEAHALVSFKLVPFSKAEIRIKTQNAIVDQLCEKINAIEDLDWNLAKQFILEQLQPIESTYV